MNKNYFSLSSGRDTNLNSGFFANLAGLGAQTTEKTRASWQWFCVLFVSLFIGINMNAQTTVIDGTGAGSFEGANFAADGWITNQGALASNNLAIGNAGTIGFTPTHGTKGVFVTTNGTSRGYSSSASWAWIYKDVTLPAGETIATVSMDVFGNPGDAGFDGIVVGVSADTFIASLTTGATSSMTATAVPGMTIANTTETNTFMLSSSYATATNKTFTIPGAALGNGLASTVRRIWIGWRCDGSVGTLTAPISFDKVHLTTSAPSAFASTAVGGLWSSPATWVSGIVPAAGNDITIATGATVTVDQVISYRNLTINGTLQWNGTSTNTLTLAGNLLINAGARFLPFTTALTGITVSIGGNLQNDGYANFAVASSALVFNGTGSTLSGSGIFQGDGTKGIIRSLNFNSTGSNSITTSQNLIVTAGIALTAASLNTNGKLTLDNTAQVYGQALNMSVDHLVVTAMGSLYNVAPVVFGAAVVQWSNITGTLSTLYVSGNNVYRCTAAANIGPAAPTHTSGISQNLLWVGTIGTLGNAFIAASTLGTQYFYGGNLYTCTVAGTALYAAPPTCTTLGGTCTSGAATFRYVGSPAMASVNYDATNQVVRSLTLVNAGSGYTSAPSISISVGVLGGTGSGASSSVVFIQQTAGAASSLVQRSGEATISGGLTINSDQGASLASTDEQASSGVGAISTTSGGNNYTTAPVVGFALPTALNLVTNPGSGYVTAPTITVSGGNLVSGTALSTTNFTINVNQGVVESVYLNASTTATYSVLPTLTFSVGSATLAFPVGCLPTATASIGSNGQLTNFTMTNAGYGYIVAPTVGVGTANATANGGQFTTVATAPTARIALYNYTTNFFTPATASVPAPDDAFIPANRKINTLSLAGASGSGLVLTNKLTLYGTAPLSLTGSNSATGNVLNMGGNDLLFTWNGYAGSNSASIVPLAVTYVTNGSITLTGRGGASVFNYPFPGTFTWTAGSTPTAVTTGSTALKVKVSIPAAAPTNSSGGTGIAIGTRAYKVETSSTFGAAAITGIVSATAATAPSATLTYNTIDALATTQDQTFVGSASAISGPWNTRSTSVGASGALVLPGTKATSVVTPNTIATTGTEYYAFATSAPTITSVTPTTLCQSSGTFTITGTGLSGVTAVTIGGTPVASFTVVSATSITGFAGLGTNGFVAVTKNGAITTDTTAITVVASPTAPMVSPSSASINMGAAVSFTATGTGGTLNWYNVANGGTSIFTGDTYTGNVCATSTLYVAENNGSCEGTRTPVTVTVAPIVATSSVASFCGTGSAFTLSATPVDPSITYTWTSLNPATATTDAAGNVSSITATTDFMVTATSGACSKTAFVSVGVYALPTATVTTTASGVCPGTSATIGSGLSAGAFSVSSIPYKAFTIPPTAVTVIDNTTSTASLSGGSLDDGGWAGIPIGFNFNYFGTNFSSIAAGTNGLLMFGTVPGYGTAAGQLGQFTFNTTGGVFPNVNNPGNIIALMAGDQTFGGAGALRYWTEGYAPNRKFVLLYDAVPSCCASTNPKFTAYVILYETTGVVDIHILNKAATNSSTIGLQDATKAIGSVAPGRQAFTTTITTPEAWRFSPPANYTTSWFADSGSGPVQFATGTNIFSRTVSPTVTTTYSISYTNQTTGCTNAPGSAQVVMSVLDNVAPTGVNTLSSLPSVCVGGNTNLTLDYAGLPDGLAFQWQVSINAGATFTDISGATLTNYFAAPTVLSSYRCKISKCGATVGAVNSYSSVFALPFTNNILTTTGDLLCGTKTHSLQATGNAGTTIRWYDAMTGGTLVATGSPFVTPLLSAATTYYVAAETTGCSSIRVAVLAGFTAAPALTISASSAAVCTGGSSSLITLTSPITNYDTYTWFPATGVTGDAINGWIFSDANTTSHTLTASQTTGGCDSTVSFVFTVNHTPITATASVATYCNGGSSVLTAASNVITSGPTGLPATYCVPSASGGAFVSSVVFNTLNSAYTQITPFYDIIAPTGANTTTLNAGATYPITITTSSASICSVWIDYNRNGLYEASEWQQPWTSATSGTLSITIPLTATAGQTGMRVRTRGSGNANGATDACTAFFSGSTQDYTVTIQGFVDNSANMSYVWSPGGATTAAITVSPSTTTTYTVNGTNTVTGCTNSATVTVNVNAIPTAPSAISTLQCGAAVPTASVADTNSFTTPTFKWYDDNLTLTTLQVSTSTTYTTSISATTTFYVSVVNPTTGCESARTPVTVTVTPANGITVTPTAPSVCLGASIALSASSAGSYTYTWTVSPESGSGMSGILAGASQTVTPTLPGVYTYTVFGTDGLCATTNTVVATINAIPQSTTPTATLATVCPGGITALTATNSPILFDTSLGNALDPMVGATQVINASNDDTPTAAPANIGFSFDLNGTPYTQYSVSPDGWLLLGGGTATSSFSNSAVLTSNIPKLYPYWDDLATGLGGAVKTLVTGTAPNRIFIVEWFVTIPRNTTGAANSRMQAWLYETSNKIEYRYGAMGPQTAGSATAGYTIDAATFENITFTSNTTSSTATNDANAGLPVSGRMYSYTPNTFGNITWSPVTDLYTDPAATVAYTGGTASVVFSKPTADITYTATTQNPTSLCSSSKTIAISVSTGATVAPLAATYSACTAGAINLTVVATGSGLTYQWRKGGVNLNTNASTTTASLALTGVTVADNGSYDVVVTPLCGSPITSSATAVTVNPIPTVTLAPQTFCGGVATTAITLTGTPSGVTFDITGGAAIGLANQTAVTAIPVFTPIAGSATVTITANANGCVGVATPVLFTVNVTPTITVSPSTANVCASGAAAALTVTLPSPSVYCIPTVTSSGATSDNITNFTFAGINNTTGDGPGDYNAYLTPSAVVTAGVATPFSITPNSAFGQQFRIWVDMNQNGAFEASESVFATSASSTVTVNGTLTIPTTAFNGTTRLRVQDRFSSVTAATEACAFSGFGEYEDYTVTISGATNNGVVWSPTAGLFTNPGATIAYMGGVAATVYAKPTSTQTYVASYAINGCGTTASSTVTVLTDSVGGSAAASSQTICPASTAGDITLVGNTGAVVKWQLSSDAGFTSPIDIATTSTTLSSALIGAVAATTYVRAQIQSPGCAVVYSTSAIITAATASWSGSAWLPAAPDATMGAVIANAYSAAGDVTACSLTVSGGAIVTVPTGSDFTITGAVSVATGSSLTFENNANLIQTGSTTTLQNSGSITSKRNTSMRRLDYTYWSSPVEGQNLKTFSPQTVSPPVGSSRFYELTENPTAFVAVDPLMTSFGLAKGYSVRAPNNFPTNASVATFNGMFTGTPRTGDISIAATNTATTGTGFNLIGNPYPSPISAAALIATNPGTCYFWTHFLQGSTSSNYASFNATGATASLSGGIMPNGIIQTGQGFLVHVAVNTAIQFTNAMRVGNNDGQFFRTADTDRSRIWLNLNTATQAMNQILIGYLPGASQGFDAAIDGKLNANGSTISTVMNDENYVIQGRALPFATTDVVPMGFKALTDDTYTISIDHVDGLFDTQNIYLKDNVTDSIHDLKLSSYTFAATAGTDNTRFEIVYDNLLATQTPKFDTNSVVIFKQNNVLNINAGKVTMKAVKVFDIRGRLVFEQSNINARTTSLTNLKAEQQVLMVQITADDNSVVTKKVVY